MSELINAKGLGDEDLGILLLKSFIHTLLEITPMPDFMIFYNAGILSRSGRIIKP